MPKHAAPRFVRTRRAISGGAVAAGATAVGLGVLTTPAQAATHDWSGVAQCESGGNWSINTGNGFYGGLQFTAGTWAGYGGTAYAPTANLASAGQQIEVAERVLASQGIGAWPTCGARLTGGSTSVAAAPAPKAAPAPAPAPAPKAVVPPAPVQQAPVQQAPVEQAPTHASRATRPAPVQQVEEQVAPASSRASSASTGNTYTVQSGDTLNKIAAAQGIDGGWQELWQDNRSLIANPNLIFPGQVLHF